MFTVSQIYRTDAEFAEGGDRSVGVHPRRPFVADELRRYGQPESSYRRGRRGRREDPRTELRIEAANPDLVLLCDLGASAVEHGTASVVFGFVQRALDLVHEVLQPFEG